MDNDLRIFQCVLCGILHDARNGAIPEECERVFERELQEIERETREGIDARVN